MVHLAGLEEGYVPSSHARTEAALAEERRLLYVALTRAEHTLSLSWAQRRTFGDRVRSNDHPHGGWRRCARRATNCVRPTPRRAPLTAAAWSMPRGSRSSAAHPHPGRVAPDATEITSALRAWRAHAARAAGVPEAVVLPDRVLTALVRSRPADAAALAEVPGLGRVKADRYADELLPLLGVAAGRPELEARG